MPISSQYQNQNNNINQNSQDDYNMPGQSTNNRAEEIAGGMKNALERGQNINYIRQSFINAGYKPYEVQQAVAIVQSLQRQAVQNTYSEKPKKTSFFKKILNIFKKIKPHKLNQQPQQMQQPSQIKPQTNLPQKQSQPSINQSRNLGTEKTQNTNKPQQQTDSQKHKFKERPFTISPLQQQYQQKEKFSRKLIIAIIIVAIMILIGSALLGLYWNQIFA